MSPRPPSPRLAADYRGPRRAARWPEKLLAWYTYWRVRSRGSRGGLFFVDRRRLLGDRLAQPGRPDEPTARLRGRGRLAFSRPQRLSRRRTSL